MDLTTTYLGLALRNPLVASASPMSQTVAGADVVMTASALLRHGPEHATVLLDGLTAWMNRKGFTTVRDLRGMLRVPPDQDQTEYERSSYISAIRIATSHYGPV